MSSKRDARVGGMIGGVCALAIGVAGCSSGPEPAFEKALGGEAISTAAITRKLDDAANESISDPDHLQQVLARIENVSDALGAFENELITTTEAAITLNSDYNASRDQFEQLSQRFSAARKGQAQRFMLASMSLRSTCTREEWKKLSESLDDLVGAKPKEKKK